MAQRKQGLRPQVQPTPQETFGLIFAELERVSMSGKVFPNGIDQVELELGIGGPAAFSLKLKVSGPSPRTSHVSQFASTIVFDACKTVSGDAAAMKDCNKFVKKVASMCGITIDSGANADEIVDIIGSAPWKFDIPLGAAEAAMEKAATGFLVVAGMKKSEFSKPHSNGHVAIVHGESVAGHPGFPHASWGSLDLNGKFYGSIRDCFPVSDLARVHYGYIQI